MNYLKCLKRGWNKKEGRGNKDCKRGRQAGSRGGCIKKGGPGTPLQTMVHRETDSMISTILCYIFHCNCAEVSLCSG